VDHHRGFDRLEEGDQGRQRGYVARVVRDVGQGVFWGTQVQHRDAGVWGLGLQEQRDDVVSQETAASDYEDVAEGGFVVDSCHC